MKYFSYVICASLMLMANVWADEKTSSAEASKELVKYVKKNLGTIELHGVRDVRIEDITRRDVESITLNEDSVECLGANSLVVGDLAVGTCLAKGSLDYETYSDDAMFAVTVSQDKRASTRSATVQVLTTEE